MVIKLYSGTYTPKLRFYIFCGYLEWSKNHRVFSLYMQDYIRYSSLGILDTRHNLSRTHFIKQFNIIIVDSLHTILWEESELYKLEGAKARGPNVLSFEVAMGTNCYYVVWCFTPLQRFDSHSTKNQAGNGADANTVHAVYYW